MPEAPGFVLRRLYFMSALIDLLAGLARFSQSHGQLFPNPVKEELPTMYPERRKGFILPRNE
jgi:hypothetical protein